MGKRLRCPPVALQRELFAVSPRKTWRHLHCPADSCMAACDCQSATNGTKGQQRKLWRGQGVRCGYVADKNRCMYLGLKWISACARDLKSVRKRFRSTRPRAANKLRSWTAHASMHRSVCTMSTGLCVHGAMSSVDGTHAHASVNVDPF